MLINPYIEATPLVLHGLVPRLDMKGVARSARAHASTDPARRHAPALRPASQVHCPVFCESLRSPKPRCHNCEVYNAMYRTLPYLNADDSILMNSVL